MRTLKIPSVTFWTNLVCAIAAVGSELTAVAFGLFPAHVAHAVAGIAVAAIWFRNRHGSLVKPGGQPQSPSGLLGVLLKDLSGPGLVVQPPQQVQQPEQQQGQNSGNQNPGDQIWPEELGDDPQQNRSGS